MSNPQIELAMKAVILCLYDKARHQGGEHAMTTICSVGQKVDLLARLSWCLCTDYAC